MRRPFLAVVGKLRWALLLGAIALGLLAFAPIVGLGNPAIVRMRGQVRSVRRIEDETEICLDHPVDSGSSYDIGKLEDPECWRGIVEGRLPASRDCVTLQIQDEGSNLDVNEATSC